MITLLPQPISPFEQAQGLITHLRRADAPPEKPPRRCLDCGLILLTNSRRAFRCSSCYALYRGVRRKRHGGVLAALMLVALSVIITPAWGQAGANLGSNSSPVTNRQGIPLAGVNIAVCQPVLISGATVTANLGIFTLSGSPVGFKAGMQILVQGFTGADTYLNAGTLTNGQITGGWTILSVAGSTITFSIVHANATATSQGTALQQGNGTTSCAGLVAVFSDPSLVFPVSQPFQSDQLGNWNVFATPGLYYVQFYSTTTTATVKVFNILSGPNLLASNNNWTGINNFTILNIAGLPGVNVQGTPVAGHCTLWFGPNTVADAGSACGSGGGGGGSGTVIASPQFQFAIFPNPGSVATVAGTGITTDATGINLTVPGILNVTGAATITGILTGKASAIFAGPRPYVDVTAPPYNCDPTGAVDCTAGIQAAINAACTAQSYPFFPPGNYTVSQPQAPSNAPILTPGAGCNNAGHGLYMLGQGTNGTSGSFVPQARIFVNNGASPGLGPLLALAASGGANGVGSARIENLALQCYNQCIQGNMGGDWYFVNDDMTVTAPQTSCSTFGCTTDTAAVALYGGLEFYFIGGTYINNNTQSGSNTAPAPAILISTDSLNHSAGLINIFNSILFGPVVDSALSSPSSGWGTVYENNVVFEDLGNQSAFVLRNFGSTTSFSSLNLTNVLVADSNPGFPLIYLNGASFYNGINITTSQPSTNFPAVIQVANAGFLGGCTGGIAINNSGATIPGCVGSNESGFTFIGPSTYSNNVPPYYTTAQYGFSGTPIQMTRAGEANASLSIDPLMGIMYGPGITVGGYDISIARSGAQSVGISFARALPPTLITAAVAAGGSLTVGAHKFGVVSAVGAANCNTITNYFLTASATTTPGNQSVQVGWTVPSILTNITGYCVLRDPSSTAAVQAIFVAGSATNTFTDVGTGGSLISGPVINNTFPVTPQVTITSAGISPGISGLTTGVIPQAASASSLTNSSPQLDTITNANGLTFAGSAGLFAVSATLSGLTPNRCLQSGIAGLVTVASGACSTGGTVLSVAVTTPAWLAVGGSPITTSGTIAITAATGQTAGQVIGTCGAATSFGPCALTTTDIPTLNQNTTGTAGGLTGCVTTTPGSICYWNGSVWVVLAGNASGTNVLTENASGVPSWAAGGGGSVGPGTTNGVAYFNASNTVTSTTPPTVNGQYTCGYLVVASVAVPPTCTLVTLSGGTIGGTGAAYTTSTSDNSSVITHLNSGTVSVTFTLSTPTTVLNTNPVYSITNHSSHNDTIATAGGFTIQQGGNAPAGTIPLNSGVECRLIIDPSNPTTNWLADCRPNGGAGSVAFSAITSGTSTGALLVGTGGSLGPTGTGTIEATQLWLVTLSSTAPAGAGQCEITTSTTTATWQNCGTSINFPAPVTGTTTAGHFTYFSNATTLSNNANLDDGITVANALTYVGTTGIFASLGPIEAGLSGAGVGQPFIFEEGTVPAGAVNLDKCYGDSTLHGVKCSFSNGTFLPVPLGAAVTVTGNLASWGNTTGNSILDSGVAFANVVTATGAAANANQVCISAGLTKSCTYIDFPETHPYPSANCFNANPGDAWSSNVSAVCRGGTANKGGYIPLTSATTAQFALPLPLDWDTANLPQIRFQISSTDVTSGHTIIPSIQVACTNPNGGTDDPTFNAAHSSSTITLGTVANQMWNTSHVPMNATDMTGCFVGSWMIIQITRAADTATSANFYGATVTIPRLIAVQAN